jgi:hypothetical protein
VVLGLANEKTFIGGIWSLISNGESLKFSKEEWIEKAMLLGDFYASNA